MFLGRSHHYSALNDWDSVLLLLYFLSLWIYQLRLNAALIFFISNSHFSYLLSTIHVMDVTIDYLTCTEYVKLRPQQFFGITLYCVV